MYGIALFVHVSGAILLFVAIAIEMLCGINMVRAKRMEELRLWSRAMTVIDKLFPIAAVLLIGAGVYLTLTQFSFRTPFAVVGLTGLIAVMVQSNLVQARAWKAVHAASVDGPDGPIPRDLVARMTRPGLWASIFADSSAAVGAVVIMTNKPGWIASIAIVVGLTAVGALLGPLVVRSRPAQAAVAPPKIA